MGPERSRCCLSMCTGCRVLRDWRVCDAGVVTRGQVGRCCFGGLASGVSDHQLVSGSMGLWLGWLFAVDPSRREPGAAAAWAWRGAGGTLGLRPSGEAVAVQGHVLGLA
jgi:hypothetical protein